VHHALDCTFCHTEGFDKVPHTSQATDDCVDCHEGPATPPIDFDKIARAMKASVHVKMVDADFRCTDCHSPHYFIPSSRMTNISEVIPVFNKSCLGCHAAGDTPAARQLAFEGLTQKHRLFPHVELHLQRNVCVACHTPRDQQTLHLILPKSEAIRDCTPCHSQNSLMVSRLYAFLAVQRRAEHGGVNAILFNEAYVTGAIRNRWLDWATLGLTGLTALGVAAHGVGRWLFAGFRRRL
jgi:hypothetical protein